MHYLGEDDFQKEMTDTVVPYLQRIRKTGYYYSTDDAKIYYESYINENERAAIVISHGFCEFTAKYEEVIYYFLNSGYSVFIVDHRGHGYSQRYVGDMSKVYVRSFDEYVDDLALFVMKIVSAESLSHKYVLYAHSMGGAIGALLLEEYPEMFECAILSSPMLMMDFGGISDRMAAVLGCVARWLRLDKRYAVSQYGFDGISNFETSSCVSEVRYNYLFQKRVDNVMYRMYGATYGWTCAGMKAVKCLQEHADRVKIPILLFQAGRDTTVKPEGQNTFAANTVNTRLEVMEDSKHEIFNADEATREKYYNDIWAFIQENIDK